MPGVILTLLEHPGTAPELLAASECLAHLLGGANIEVLVVRLPPEATILPSEEVLTKRREAEIRTREQVRVAALRRNFDSWVTKAGRGAASATWCELEALVNAVLKERGAGSDVIILRRPTDTDRMPAREEIRTALFETDRPVLVVPPNVLTPFGRRVAIAWRNDRPATRAVLSALRSRAKPERIFLLAGVRQDAPLPTMPDILLEHEVPAELHVLPLGSGAFGEILLAKAHALSADLLVMGAYLHSPLRELILGGVTRFMLDHADLPLLMRH